MNTFTTRVYVIQHTISGRYLNKYTESKGLDNDPWYAPDPKLEWSVLDDAILFGSARELKDFVTSRPWLNRHMNSANYRMVSIPVELRIEKVTNISGQRR